MIAVRGSVYWRRRFKLNQGDNVNDLKTTFRETLFGATEQRFIRNFSISVA